jgi:putative transposase
MPLRRSAHAVWDCSYHIVLTPKYRHDIFVGAVRDRTDVVLRDIALSYDVIIDTMEVAPDHVHIFCSFPPKWSVSDIVSRFKSLSARTLFAEFPALKKRLWGGSIWADGYFVRTVGDEVTATVVRRYIEAHQEGEAIPDTPEQLRLL